MIWDYFKQVESHLIRHPQIDPQAFEFKVQAFLTRS